MYIRFKKHPTGFNPLLFLTKATRFSAFSQNVSFPYYSRQQKITPPCELHIQPTFCYQFLVYAARTHYDTHHREFQPHVQSHCSIYEAPFKVQATYLLHGAESFLRSKPVNCAASQEIPRIYGTRKFLTVATSARHPSLS